MTFRHPCIFGGPWAKYYLLWWRLVLDCSFYCLTFFSKRPYSMPKRKRTAIMITLDVWLQQMWNWLMKRTRMLLPMNISLFHWFIIVTLIVTMCQFGWSSRHIAGAISIGNACSTSRFVMFCPMSWEFLVPRGSGVTECVYTSWVCTIIQKEIHDP